MKNVVGIKNFTTYKLTWCVKYKETKKPPPIKGATLI